MSRMKVFVNGKEIEGDLEIRVEMDEEVEITFTARHLDLINGFPARNQVTFIKPRNVVGTIAKKRGDIEFVRIRRD